MALGGHGQWRLEGGRDEMARGRSGWLGRGGWRRALRRVRDRWPRGHGVDAGRGAMRMLRAKLARDEMGGLSGGCDGRTERGMRWVNLGEGEQGM